MVHIQCTCAHSNMSLYPLFGSRKCIASTGIAVGTSTEVRYTENVCYWEGLLSEVPLYIAISICQHLSLVQHHYMQ